MDGRSHFRIRTAMKGSGDAELEELCRRYCIRLKRALFVGCLLVAALGSTGVLATLVLRAPVSTLLERRPPAAATSTGTRGRAG
jgi:hypothetical protein